MNRRLVSNLFVRYRLKSHGGAALVGCLLLLSATLSTSSGKNHTDNERSLLGDKVAQSIKEISKDRTSAVVRVRCHDDHGEIVGTGFVIDPTGTIITLSEIIRDGKDITVELNGNGEIKSLPATLMATDPRSGIAFLKISSTNGTPTFLHPIPISSAPKLTPVISIGYPREAPAAPVLGMITGSKNHEGETFLCVTHFTASLPLSEGEGGAPVFDLNGNLIGIVITGNPQLGTCTILPSSAIEHLHHDLLCYGGINPGWVGAVVELAAIPQKNSLTRVVSVAQGSPAEAAGIRPGDTLLSLGAHAIRTPDDVLDASFYLTAGESLSVSIARDGTVGHLTLRCSDLPSVDIGSESALPSQPPNLLGETAH